MQVNYEAAYQYIRRWEGGKVDDPNDPGGRTKWGVTQRTYDAWRTTHGRPVKDVYDMVEHECADIYYQNYAKPVRFDELPSGLDYAVFDFAIHSGPSRAASMLQEIVRATPDGIIGVQTLAAIKKRPTDELIRLLCDDRLDFMKTLRHWPTYANGWSNRVEGVKVEALDMYNGAPTPSSSPDETPLPKARPTDQAPWWLVLLNLITGIFK